MRSPPKKRKPPIRPGDVVGRRSPKDDTLPHQRHQRDVSIPAANRGRAEPSHGSPSSPARNPRSRRRA